MSAELHVGELLALAARAAKVCLHPADKLVKSYGNWGCDTTCTVCKKDPHDAIWDPLRSDGDALRLAVDLQMQLDQGDDEGPCALVGYYHNRDIFYIIEPDKGDSYAAMRRAIVRAAAEIGKAMQ